MITNPETMVKALKRKAFAGLILWQGASALDGAPIAVIATGMGRKSRNAKTGEMVQTFVIRTDLHPVEALKTGADASICGDCKHRPVNGGACYVNVPKSVASVFAAFKRGRYARVGVDYDAAIIPDVFAGRVFRLGSYGDPSAAPFQIWRAATLKAAAKAGYSHQWRDARFAAFRLLCMASCDTESERDEARALGWRSFRVRRDDETLGDREIACPASEESGFKTTCEKCRACGGTSAKARADVAIIVHGISKARFTAVQAKYL